MGGHIAWVVAEVAIRALFLRRMWREAMPEDRWVWTIIGAQLAVLLIVGFWPG